MYLKLVNNKHNLKIVIKDPRYFVLIGPSLEQDTKDSLVYIDAIVVQAMEKYLRPKWKYLMNNDSFRAQLYPNVKLTYTKDYTVYTLGINLGDKVFCDPESPICR